MGFYRDLVNSGKLHDGQDFKTRCAVIDRELGVRDPQMQDAFKHLIMPVDTVSVNFDKVVLTNDIRVQYEQFMNEYNHREELLRIGYPPANRILLYGASGTGKTFSLKALSNKLGLCMLYVDIGRALLTGVADNIRSIFDLAEFLGDGVLLFFDECDAVAWGRNTSESGKDSARTATNTIFQCLDQMDPHIVFAGATNMQARLDTAFVRRFDYLIRFERPTEPLHKLFERFLKPDVKVVDDVKPSTRSIIERRFLQAPDASYYMIEVAVGKAVKASVLRDEGAFMHTAEFYGFIAQRLRVRTDTDSEVSDGEVMQ